MVSLFSLCPPFSWWLLLQFYIISEAFCLSIQRTWQQCISKGSSSSPKELLSFPSIIKNRKRTKICAQADTNDNVIREIAYANVFPELGLVLCSWARVSEAGSWMCICSRGRPLHLTTNAAMGLKELVDVLFSFETRYSSQVLCLQAACSHFASA